MQPGAHRSAEDLREGVLAQFDVYAWHYSDRKGVAVTPKDQ